MIAVAWLVNHQHDRKIILLLRASERKIMGRDEKHINRTDLLGYAGTHRDDSRHTDRLAIKWPNAGGSRQTQHDSFCAEWVQPVKALLHSWLSH